jgi:hypothetical protein
MAAPQEVAELVIWERPPSMLRNVDGGSLGGVGAKDPKAPTINAMKRRQQAPWEVPELASGSRARNAYGACPSDRVVNGCRNLDINAQRVVRTNFTLT